MTDIEIVKACASAMGLDVRDTSDGLIIFVSGHATGKIYTPLTDDAQAMALVKHLKLDAVYSPSKGLWAAGKAGDHIYIVIENDPDLNRAICKVVANLSRAG